MAEHSQTHSDIWPNKAHSVPPSTGKTSTGAPGDQQVEQAAGRVSYARTDGELSDLLTASRGGLGKQAVVEYGSSWCAHCQEMFPHFHRLCAQHPAHHFIVAQLDVLEAGARGVRFTPTFAFWRKGRKVDQFWGSDPRQLRDRVWLHADGDAPEPGAGGVTADRGGERAAAQAQPLPSAGSG